MPILFEIYTTGPDGVRGWEIQWVRCFHSDIASFPNFDCIITANDTPSKDTAIICWNGIEATFED